MRLFKSRSLASEAVGGGKVKLDGERVKPAHEVRIGQRLSVTLGDSPDPVRVGGEVVFTAVARNQGPSAASATTRKIPPVSTICFTPARKIGWSSAIKMSVGIRL